MNSDGELPDDLKADITSAIAGALGSAVSAEDVFITGVKSVAAGRRRLDYGQAAFVIEVSFTVKVSPSLAEAVKADIMKPAFQTKLANEAAKSPVLSKTFTETVGVAAPIVQTDDGSPAEAAVLSASSRAVAGLPVALLALFAASRAAPPL